MAIQIGIGQQIIDDLVNLYFGYLGCNRVIRIRVAHQVI